VTDPESTRRPVDKLVEQNVRRTVAFNALRKIGVIVAEEQQADAAKAEFLRWMLRYGWLMVLGCAMILAYFMGFI
jgi:hypothetical protein